MILSTRDRHIYEEEISQATARVLWSFFCSVFMFIALFLDALTLEAPLIVLGYFILSIIWLKMIKKYSRSTPARRRVSVISDFSIVTYTMYSVIDIGAIFFFLYLWVIVGNGMRFGIKPMLEAMILGVAGFSIVIFSSDYWQENIQIGISLLVGLVVLPLFFLVLIRRLHNLNDKLERELEKTTYAATHDGMTDLLNRAYFFQRVTDKIAEAKRYRQKFTVLFIDLDGFKQINDSFGHKYGDELLKAISKRLKKITRESDIVARLGGDEFALMLHTMSEKSDIEVFTSKLIGEVSKDVIVDGKTLNVTASVGISFYPDQAATPDMLVSVADSAMYMAKKAGKNRYVFGDNIKVSISAG